MTIFGCCSKSSTHRAALDITAHCSKVNPCLSLTLGLSKASGIRVRFNASTSSAATWSCSVSHPGSSYNAWQSAKYRSVFGYDRMPAPANAAHTSNIVLRFPTKPKILDTKADIMVAHELEQGKRLGCHG